MCGTVDFENTPLEGDSYLDYNVLSRSIRLPVRGNRGFGTLAFGEGVQGEEVCRRHAADVGYGLQYPGTLIGSHECHILHVAVTYSDLNPRVASRKSEPVSKTPYLRPFLHLCFHQQ